MQHDDVLRNLRELCDLLKEGPVTVYPVHEFVANMPFENVNIDYEKLEDLLVIWEDKK